VIHPDGEAHPLDRLGRAGARLGLGAKAHPARCLPHVHAHRLVTHVEEANQPAVAAQEHPVAAGARQPVGAGWDDVTLESGAYRSFKRWMSTRNDRVAATSTRFCLPRARRSVRLERGRRSNRTSTKLATPIRNPPVAATTAAGSDTSLLRSTGRGSARTGSGRTSASDSGCGGGVGSGTSGECTHRLGRARRSPLRPPVRSRRAAARTSGSASRSRRPSPAWPGSSTCWSRGSSPSRPT
jgi:hypothetical protein